MITKAKEFSRSIESMRGWDTLIKSKINGPVMLVPVGQYEGGDMKGANMIH